MNTKLATILLTCGALTMYGCDNDPVKDAPRAQTSAPVEQAQKSEPKKEESTTTLPLSSANSTVKFVGAKITDKHAGSFGEVSGAIDLVDGDPTKSSVRVSIAMESLSIEPPKLDGHLRSADFFDVEKFPESTFESTSIAKGEDGKFNVVGNLTLHGEKKAISFPATIDVQGQSVSVKAKFGINRKDFGIVYPGMPDDLIKDEVLIDLSLQPKKS